mgnify:FL=1
MKVFGLSASFFSSAVRATAKQTESTRKTFIVAYKCQTVATRLQPGLLFPTEGVELSVHDYIGFGAGGSSVVTVRLNCTIFTQFPLKRIKKTFTLSFQPTGFGTSVFGFFGYFDFWLAKICGWQRDVKNPRSQCRTKKYSHCKSKDHILVEVKSRSLSSFCNLTLCA